MFLFAAGMTLLTVWAYVHWQAYTAEIQLLGAISVAALLKFALSWFGRFLPDDDEQKKALASPGMLANVIALCAGAASLFVMTESVYVKSGNDKIRRAVIDVRRGAARVMNPIVLDSKTQLDGRPFFSWLRSNDLRLVVTDPPGYDELRIRVPLGFTRTLTFPDDFAPPIVRLLPGRSLIDVALGPNDKADVALHVCRLSNGKRENHWVLVPEFHYQPHYFGSTNLMLVESAAARAALDPRFELELLNYAVKNGARTDAQRKQFVSDLRDNRLAVPIPKNLTAEDTIQIALAVSNEARACAEKKLSGEMTTIYLESEPCQQQVLQCLSSQRQ
ncbi:MAG TPA: hypothetical protein VF057_09090 [Thermoanaerobaculia bacterium]